MKRLLFVILLGMLSSACVHRWVGRPVEQLEKEYGSPRNIQRLGDSSIYYYPDMLAGHGQMTFIVDHKGIIRAWCATTDVPGPWLDDIYGNPIDGPLNNGVNNRTNGGLNPGGPNGGVGSRVGDLPSTLPISTCP